VSGKALTHNNDSPAFATLGDLPAARGVRVCRAARRFSVRPVSEAAGLRREKKYPLIYLIHGGPQGAWTDSWVAVEHQMFAAGGRLSLPR